MITAKEARKLAGAMPLSEVLECIELEIKNAAAKGKTEVYLYKSIIINPYIYICASIVDALTKAGFQIKEDSERLHISWDKEQ